MRAGLYSSFWMYVIWAVLGAIYLFQSFNAWYANRDLMVGTKHYPSDDRYSFSQVAILELTYIVNFGSELAVVTVLPVFFEQNFWPREKLGWCHCLQLCLHEFDVSSGWRSNF